MSASDADRLRIAIGLSLLKFKPAEQSCSSYILDVLDRFPSRDCSGGLAPSPDGVRWRERAMRLEREIKELRARYESDHIKLLAFGEIEKPSVPVPDEVQGGKKAKKKSSQQQQQRKTLQLDNNLSLRIDPEVLLTGLNRLCDIPTMLGDISIFACFDNLNRLMAVIEKNGSVATNWVVPATDRALQAVGTLLRSVLQGAHAANATDEILGTVADLSSYVIASVLPCLDQNRRKKGKVSTRPGSMSSGASTNDILQSLARWVCVPVIQAFSSLSVQWTSRVFVACGQKKRRLSSNGEIGSKSSDSRQALICLLKKVMSTVANVIPPGAGDLRELLAVETLREVERLHEDTCTDADWRVIRLARKDTFWFLCSTLLWLFSPRSDVDGGMRTPVPLGKADGSGGLLREGILRTLSRLIKRHEISRKGLGCVANGNGEECKGGRRVEVERGMLLAVLERVWVVSLNVPDGMVSRV